MSVVLYAVLCLIVIWAFFPESGAEKVGGFFTSRNQKWRRILKIQASDENGNPLN